jgi:hypothetical protein
MNAADDFWVIYHGWGGRIPHINNSDCIVVIRITRGTVICVVILARRIYDIEHGKEFVAPVYVYVVPTNSKGQL